MLREVSDVRQVRGEPRRRWFSSAGIDLFVWVDDAGAPTGFQLCYDKQSKEHALTWKEGHGFNHMAIDSGESRPTKYKGSPILVPNGSVEMARVIESFRSEARELPPEIVALVERQLGRWASGEED